VKVLAYTSPARGHVYPLVPTLLELRSRGHQVAVRTLASEVELLAQLGLAASRMNPLLVAREMDDWRGKNQLAQLQRALTAFVERAEHGMREGAARVAQAFVAAGGGPVAADALETAAR
jgi:UDP:flavonoid glycosyltransferase YjiC (YdhE family)